MSEQPKNNLVDQHIAVSSYFEAMLNDVAQIPTDEENHSDKKIVDEHLEDVNVEKDVSLSVDINKKPALSQYTPFTDESQNNYEVEVEVELENEIKQINHTNTRSLATSLSTKVANQDEIQFSETKPEASIIFNDDPSINVESNHLTRELLTSTYNNNILPQIDEIELENELDEHDKTPLVEHESPAVHCLNNSDLVDVIRAEDVSDTENIAIIETHETDKNPIGFRENDISKVKNQAWFDAAETEDIAKKHRILNLPEWTNTEFQALYFHIGEHSFIAPLHLLHGVLEGSHKFTSLPHVAPWFVGLYRNRDRNVKVIDLEKYLDIKQLKENKSPPSFVLLIAQGRWGIAIDKVDTVLKIDESSVQWESQTSGIDKQIIIGTEKHNMCSVLDVDYLASMLDEGEES